MRGGQPVNLTVVIKSRPYNLAAGHMNFGMVVKELNKENPDVNRIIRLMSQVEAIKEYSDNKVVHKDGKFFYKGEEIKGVLVTRIKEFMTQNLPYKPLMRFLENLMKNPSARSRELVYTFLENESLPLTPDGCFLGYKGAQANFWSIHTGHHTMISGKQNERGEIFYGKGEKVRVPWNEVVDDPNVSCARGLHVGSFNYANGWGGTGGSLVLVKVNPADVVSVTHNCKEVMRVCAYDVVDILSVREALKQALEPQYLAPDDEDAPSYHNVRDAKGRFRKVRKGKR